MIGRTLKFGLRQLLSRPVAPFAKEAAGKKGKQEEPQPEPVKEPTDAQLIAKWLQPNHPSLSQAELHHYENGFDDLCESDKEILNDLAQKILDQPTAIFYQVAYHHNSLGTTGDVLLTAVDPVPENDLHKVVRRVRKIA